MITAVVMRLRWTPEYINTLYVDALDHNGLEYWYNVILKESKDIENITKK